MNIFVKPTDEYVRRIELFKEAVMDLAYGLHIRTGDPYEKTFDFVANYVAFENTSSPTYDRPMLVYSREDCADRKPTVMTFTEYLQCIVEGRLILTPSFTAYLPPDVKKSLISIMLSANVKKRGLAKKKSSAADEAGDEEMKNFYNNLQTSYKLSNNASSGSHVSKSTYLYNLSAHPSLTATCRAATSYGNGSNEKFIAGNRHYHNYEVTINNLINICRLTDLDKVVEAVKRFNLHIPSTAEVMDMIQFSTSLYWTNAVDTAKLYDLVECMSEAQRCAVMYVSDFWHLDKYNSNISLTFLKNLSDVRASEGDIGDWYSQLDDDQKILCNFNCFQYHKVKDMRSYLKNPDSDPLVIGSVQATAKHILKTLEDIKPIADAFWCTDNMPSDVARIPSIIRRAVPVSDTDSTIFTVQEWTKKVTGEYSFSVESRCAAAAMIYISQQLVVHILAMMSANMGIPRESLYRIAMKNEYTFPVLSIINRTKHYFAGIYAKEGVMYEKFELEKKGVGLRDAGIPPLIRKDSDKFIRYVINGIMTDCSLDFESVIAWVVGVENSVVSSLLQGEGKYLPTAKVKEADSYSAKEQATARKKHALWRAVFADTYGGPAEAPYSAFKVNLKGKSKTAMKNWMARFPKAYIRDKLIAHAESIGMDKITSVYVPIDVAIEQGIPEEIREGMDIRKITYSMMMSYYLVLESLGVYNTRNPNRLLSDFYPYESIKHVKIKEVVEH